MSAATAAFTPGVLDKMRSLELRLPVEIIEKIIDAIEDRSVLKACALCCSHLRKSCQSRLFRNFTINCDHDDGLFKKGGIVYAVAFESEGGHANVMALLRRLKIENQYVAWGIPGGRRGVNSMLGKFLRKLIAVEQLELRGGGLEWNHGELAEGLLTALHIPTLKVLKLVSLENFPMSYVLRGRALKRVEFERVEFLQARKPVGLENHLVSPTLEEFKADNRRMGLSLLRIHFLSCATRDSAFTRLKKLRLDYRDTEGDRPEDINALLTACQDSLEDFVLFLTHHAYRSTEPYAKSISLGRLTHLRSFSMRLFLATRDGYLEQEHPFKLLESLFSKCPASLEKVQLSFFHRLGDAGDKSAPEASGWSGLDKVLTSMSGLLEVSVIVCCTQCTSSQMEAHEDVYDLPLTKARGLAVRRRFTDSINSALED